MIYDILQALGVLLILAGCGLGAFVWWTLRQFDDYED